MGLLGSPWISLGLFGSESLKVKGGSGVNRYDHLILVSFKTNDLSPETEKRLTVFTQKSDEMNLTLQAPNSLK